MTKMLTTINSKGKETLVIDSREVAEMLGKKHEDIMKAIKGSGKNLGIIPTLEKGNFHVSDYFIESTYKVEGNSKIYKCYLVTKMGCELLGNKQQGEKGILFSARYVERFNQMEESLRGQIQKLDSYMIENPIDRAKRWSEEYQEKVALLEENKINKPKANYYDKVLNTKGTMTTTQVAKGFGMTAQTLNTYLFDKRVQFKQGDMWIPYKEYDGKGYTQIRTFLLDDNTTKHYLVWTEKGRKMIYDLLVEDKLI